MPPRIREEVPGERSEFPTNYSNICECTESGQEKVAMSRSTFMVVLGVVAVVAVVFSGLLTMGGGMMGGMGGTMCPM
jgi:hypothetical protein